MGFFDEELEKRKIIPILITSIAVLPLGFAFFLVIQDGLSNQYTFLTHNLSLKESLLTHLNKKYFSLNVISYYICVFCKENVETIACIYDMFRNTTYIWNNLSMFIE